MQGTNELFTRNRSFLMCVGTSVKPNEYRGNWIGMVAVDSEHYGLKNEFNFPLAILRRTLKCVDHGLCPCEVVWAGGIEIIRPNDLNIAACYSRWLVPLPAHAQVAANCENLRPRLSKIDKERVQRAGVCGFRNSDN